MEHNKQPSEDSIVKGLIKDYPVDALEFFEPEIIALHGRPVEIQFPSQENTKHRYGDPALRNDIPVHYTFPDGSSAILVLIEHWSDKNKFNIHRFCHYALDLSYRNPGTDILPVALFLDKANQWKKYPPESINISCRGTRFLEFRYKLVRLKAEEARNYIRTKNRFLAVLASAMRIVPAEKIDLAIEILKNFRYTENDEQRYMRNAPVIEHFLRLSDEEHDALFKRMQEEAGMTLAERFTELGEKRGAKQARLEDAQKMLEKNLDVALIADITGLSKEEIEALES